MDCDLLNAIMEKLDLTNRQDEFVDEAIGDEEEEEELTNEDEEDGDGDGDVENSTRMYRVLVVDYETGIDYQLDKVCVVSSLSSF